MTARFTYTENFKAMEIDSRGRNCGPTEALIAALDPDGIHVLAFTMPHNDCEVRNEWLVKLLDQEEPESIWMDNSFEAFADNTFKYSKEDTCPSPESNV